MQIDILLSEGLSLRTQQITQYEFYRERLQSSAHSCCLVLHSDVWIAFGWAVLANTPGADAGRMQYPVSSTRPRRSNVPLIA